MHTLPENRILPNFFCEVNINMTQNPKEHYKNENLQASLTHKHRYLIPKYNISKPNPAVCKKDN